MISYLRVIFCYIHTFRYKSLKGLKKQLLYLYHVSSKKQSSIDDSSVHKFEHTVEQLDTWLAFLLIVAFCVIGA